jgi:hypothetical protein
MRLAAVVCALAGLLVARRARAQVDPFEFEVYPVQTIGKGLIEIESLNSFVPEGHTTGDAGTSAGTYPSNLMYRTALELTYGLTDRIEAAAYLNLAKPDAAPFQYAGSKFRLRGSFFEPGELPVDLGWYTELDWHRTPRFDDAELELEVRPIIEKDFGRLQISVDPIFEKPLVAPDTSGGFEFGYVAGIYYNYWRQASPRGRVLRRHRPHVRPRSAPRAAALRLPRDPRLPAGRPGVQFRRGHRDDARLRSGHHQAQHRVRALHRHTPLIARGSCARPPAGVPPAKGDAR